MRTLSLYLLLCLTLGTIASCGGDDGDGLLNNDCTTLAYSERVNEAVSNLGDAAVAYSSDPSDANCDAWRVAANDYLDAIEFFEDCAFFNEAEFQMELAEARLELEDFECQ